MFYQLTLVLATLAVVIGFPAPAVPSVTTHGSTLSPNLSPSLQRKAAVYRPGYVVHSKSQTTSTHTTVIPTPTAYLEVDLGGFMGIFGDSPPGGNGLALEYGGYNSTFDLSFEQHHLSRQFVIQMFEPTGVWTDAVATSSVLCTIGVTALPTATAQAVFDLVSTPGYVQTATAAEDIGAYLTCGDAVSGTPTANPFW